MSPLKLTSSLTGYFSQNKNMIWWNSCRNIWEPISPLTLSMLYSTGKPFQLLLFPSKLLWQNLNMISCSPMKNVHKKSTEKCFSSFISSLFCSLILYQLYIKNFQPDWQKAEIQSLSLKYISRITLLYHWINHLKETIAVRNNHFFLQIYSFACICFFKSLSFLPIPLSATG